MRTSRFLRVAAAFVGLSFLAGCEGEAVYDNDGLPTTALPDEPMAASEPQETFDPLAVEYGGVDSVSGAP